MPWEPPVELCAESGKRTAARNWDIICCPRCTSKVSVRRGRRIPKHYTTMPAFREWERCAMEWTATNP